jgi:segregation and condensation protein B
MSQESEREGTLPEGAASPARSLSVDQLTQAFANLLGDNPQASAGETDETAVESPDPAVSAADDDDDDLAGVTPAAILEAILFVGHPLNEPLSSRRMAGYLRGVSPQEVDGLVEELNERYREQSAPYEIVSQGAGYRLVLRDEYQRLRDRFYGKVREAKLTQSAVDLLAIVAYHQPIAQQQIDRLRGQPSGGLLTQLVRRKLLQVSYTAEKPRQKVYSTTERFLELFRLDSLADLPSYAEF